ncbi:MAG: molybdenum cofactor guanylyltransferase [Proteobacteria bacterium]|nr:molybdenum cofactor guanylyltransferase [Pseudomonadota bacterium]
MKNKDVVGVILVGGKSSRMGQDKASLIFNDLRLVDHIAETLISSGIRKIITSGIVDSYEGVPDLVKNKGPVGGICSSIIHCQENSRTTAIIIPVDMPLISSEVINFMIESLGDSEFTHFQEKPLPLVVKISESIADSCVKINQDLSNGKEMSVKSLLKNFVTSAITIPQNLAKNLINTNTPEEWSNIQNEYQNK